MPMYSYNCKCGLEEEIYQDMNTPHIYTCLACGKKMQRVWHVPKMKIGKSKPLNWEPKRMNAHNDRWAYFRSKELNGEKIPMPMLEKSGEYKRPI